MDICRQAVLSTCSSTLYIRSMISQLYRAYLQHQAASHPDLQHDDAEGSRVFAMMNIEEAVSDLRSSAQTKTYIMRGLYYTYNVTDNGEGRREVQGGFMIAKQYSSREQGSNAFFTAMDDSERIVNEMIEKIVSDSRVGHPLFFHSLDADQNFVVRPRPLVGDGYAGWFCNFTFVTSFTVCIEADDAPAWSDGGQTPFELV